MLVSPKQIFLSKDNRDTEQKLDVELTLVHLMHNLAGLSYTGHSFMMVEI